MQKVFLKYFNQLSIKSTSSDSELHILTTVEYKKVTFIFWAYCFLAAFVAALGMVFYFEPVNRYPEMFPFYNLIIDNQAYKIEWGIHLWGIFLIVLELILLVFINLKAVHSLGVATGFLTSENPEKIDFLVKLGLENKDLGLQSFGIDPFQGINKKILFLYGLVLKLKGFLANKLLQFAVKRMLGRYAIRYVMDYVGMPIYMFINALGTYSILSKTKVCIFGKTFIQKFTTDLPTLSLTDFEKELVYDTLQLIAMSKRDYHQNHLELTQQIFKKYQIQPKNIHYFNKNYYSEVANQRIEIQQICKKIVVLGFILDGKLSHREKKRIEILIQLKVIHQSVSEIEQLVFDFNKGISIEID